LKSTCHYLLLKFLAGKLTRRFPAGEAWSKLYDTTEFPELSQRCATQNRVSQQPLKTRALPIHLRPTLVFQERIVLALLADCCLRTVAGSDDGVIREGEEFVMQGIDDLFKGAPRQIGSADASRKQRITGD